MIRDLLPREGDSWHYYKTNMHCHSVYSDGRLTVKELKERFLSIGYSAIAFTDHEIFLPHNDLTDDNFVALNGTEYAIELYPFHKPIDVAKQNDVLRTTHICLVAKSPDIKAQPVYNCTDNFWGNALKYVDEVTVDSTRPYQIRLHTPEVINTIMRKAKKEGFYVTYNHPSWSFEFYPDYIRFNEMDGVEIVNGDEFRLEGVNDVHVYDDFIENGLSVTTIAGDDNHNDHPFGSPENSDGHGYTMIGAPSLNYENLIQGLEKGLVYVGTGNEYHESPRILSLTYDDETRELAIETTDAREIFMHCYGVSRVSRGFRSPVYGETVTKAAFTVPEGCHAVRLMARDTKGFMTYTNAFVLDPDA